MPTALSLEDANPQPYGDWFTYILLRGDIAMPPGKAAAQASHAARLSLLQAATLNPGLSSSFLSGRSCGSAVVLRATSARHMEHVDEECARLGLPHALFMDEGHVLPPHFDGSPIITAFAAGPAPRESLAPLFRRFRCY